MKIKKMKNIKKEKIKKWFGKGVMRYYVIVNDEMDGEKNKDEKAFNGIKKK
jgi:hypothetical protein